MISTGERSDRRDRIDGSQTGEQRKITVRGDQCLDPVSHAYRSDISSELGCHLAKAAKWRKRFAVGRLDGLADDPRPGPPREITDAVIKDVLVRTETRILAKTRFTKHMSGERRPVPVALNPDHDVLGIAHLIHPVERDHRVAMTRPWWDHTVANGRKGGRKSPFGEALEHRHLDRGALPGGLPTLLTITKFPTLCPTQIDTLNEVQYAC